MGDADPAARATDISGPGGLTHLDSAGRARMVDVSAKQSTVREAIAEGFVQMSAEALAAWREGAGPKGDARSVSELAGVMAAKRTADLIPLCHPLALSGVSVCAEAVTNGVKIEARVRTSGPTGVEMEALTAVSVACLAVYDMLKARDRAMTIGGVRLLAKSGGRSGDYRAVTVREPG